MTVAERLADAQAVVVLMNSIFRHSECGPLRAETVLRSCAAQVCVFVVAATAAAIAAAEPYCSCCCCCF